MCIRRHVFALHSIVKCFGAQDEFIELSITSFDDLDLDPGQPDSQ